MSAIAFDTLRFVRRLKEVGVPEAQAEAELMAETFVFNMNALVIRDFLEQCLDARFAAQESKLMANIDIPFEAQDKRIETGFREKDRCFVLQDRKFGKLEQKLDRQNQRFASMEARPVVHHLQFFEIRGEQKLHCWMLAIIAAGTVVPALQKVFALLAS